MCIKFKVDNDDDTLTWSADIDSYSYYTNHYPHLLSHTYFLAIFINKIKSIKINDKYFCTKPVLVSLNDDNSLLFVNINNTKNRFSSSRHILLLS